MLPGVNFFAFRFSLRFPRKHRTVTDGAAKGLHPPEAPMRDPVTMYMCGCSGARMFHVYVLLNFSNRYFACGLFDPRRVDS